MRNFGFRVPANTALLVLLRKNFQRGRIARFVKHRRGHLHKLAQIGLCPFVTKILQRGKVVLIFVLLLGARHRVVTQHTHIIPIA